jgi:hypothetical protein
MPPSQDDLWALVAGRQQAVLATVNRDGSPQLSNVLYVPDTVACTVRISTTADRVKAHNLAHDPRAALHVSGEDFWQYAVAHAVAQLSPPAEAQCGGGPGGPRPGERKPSPARDSTAPTAGASGEAR